MGFKKDKEVGNKAENIVFELLKSFGLSPVYNESKNRDELKGWDIEADGKKYEVKYDVMAKKTGNLAIEYFNPKTGKPSGIMSTCSDFWIYVVDCGEKYLIYVVSVNKLKNFIDNTKPHRIVEVGGDKNASLMLYKKECILDVVFEVFDNYAKIKQGD